MSTRKQPDVSINGLALPLRVGAEVQQSYEDFGGYSVLRLGAGAAVSQQAWRKLRTTISGTGITPPGLAGIDWTQPITLGCIAERSIQSATNVITIPAARRTDAPPYGWAITAVGMLRNTPVSMAGNVATLTPVAGAAGYQVAWYPLLSVLVLDGVRVSFDAVGAVAGWELTGDES